MINPTELETLAKETGAPLVQAIEKILYYEEKEDEE